ncbi:MAG: class I SAM-dependent methyltransferase [Candidatus Binatia bacterium]
MSAPRPADAATAAAFDASWENCYTAAPYTREQYLEWIAPLTPADLAGRSVCELGCGHGGLLRYTAEYAAGAPVTGVDLGASVEAARAHLQAAGLRNASLVREDLIAFSHANAGRFDVAYSIGVLHHMQDPEAGFRAALRLVRPGGRVHCWVYGHEGNGPVRWLVEPVRRLACRLPWRVNKYGVALPLAVPFFLVGKTMHALRHWPATDRLPMAGYFRWVGAREFAFHHHVAFDQLVTPQTQFIRQREIEAWLAAAADEIESTYLVPRNGNSWKFGGRRRGA